MGEVRETRCERWFSKIKERNGAAALRAEIAPQVLYVRDWVRLDGLSEIHLHEFRFGKVNGALPVLPNSFGNREFAV